MMVLHVHGIQKEYQGNPVLTDVSFHLAGGERVGLVGLNGCGKSTLLKILSGQMAPDGGALHWIHDGLSVAYLSQEGHWAPDRRLGDQIGFVPEDLLARCGVSRAMLNQKAGSLSGGQKTRAAIAKALADRPEVLLLDEPTNHLDTEGLQWLEQTLTGYRGTVLVVSHDRYFLDKVVGRILEMEGGRLREYPGNYSAYAQQKQLELERAEAEYATYRKEKARLEEAIRRQRQWAMAGHHGEIEFGMHKMQAGYNKAQARAHMVTARAMEKRLDRIKVEQPREAAKINLKLEASTQVGKNLILAERLGFTYDRSRWLFRGADFYIQRGERVAVVGPNGSGKSTLVKLLLGQLQPTEGRLHCAPLRVAYLAQELETLNPANTVLEEASGGNAAMDQAMVRTLLGCMLFSREAVLKRVGVLSGGEKVRLALVKILLSDPEMLVLDEPTNGLDLASRERVEEALESFPGTLLFVSHDRYLLRRIANRVLSVQGGRIESFLGDYDAFVSRQATPAGERAAAGSLADQRLLLETRLSQLSAALAAPKPEEAERLNQEFLAVSRELRAVKAQMEGRS